MIKFVRLGDACLVRRGTTITRKETQKGNVPVIAGGRKATYFHNKHNRESGVITVSGSGASAGLVNYWSIPIFASDCSTVELKDNKQNIKFIYYYMQSMQEFIYKNMRSGAAQPHVYAKDIANLNFPLFSLEEQRRIVAELDVAFAEIDKAIEFSKTKLDRAEKLKGKIISKYIFNNVATRSKVKLGKILKTGAGGTPLKSKVQYYEGGDIKWLLSGAVCKKNIYDSITFITQQGLKNSSAKIFPKNTVLVAMYGATAGQVGILRTEAATNQAVCGIYPSKEYLPEYLYYFLTDYKKTLLLEASGVAQPNLSQVKIKNILLPIIPVTEQQLIITKIDSAIAEIAKLSEYLDKQLECYKTLKVAILKQELHLKEAA